MQVTRGYICVTRARTLAHLSTDKRLTKVAYRQFKLISTRNHLICLELAIAHSVLRYGLWLWSHSVHHSMLSTKEFMFMDFSVSSYYRFVRRLCVSRFPLFTSFDLVRLFDLGKLVVLSAKWHLQPISMRVMSKKTINSLFIFRCVFFTRFFNWKFP